MTQTVRLLLFRFAILLPAMLLLWRLVLLKPLLAVSRGVAEVSFSLLPGSGSAELITLDGKGDWIVHASLLFREREVTRQTGLQSPGVRTPLQMLQCFSLCLPIFWALALVTWPGKRVLRVLGLGTFVLAIMSQLSLMAFVAYWTNQFFFVASSPFWMYLLKVTAYCSIDVVPYAVPLALVILLDPEMRRLVCGESTLQTRKRQRS
jgi:hypothetical protein